MIRYSKPRRAAVFLTQLTHDEEVAPLFHDEVVAALVDGEALFRSIYLHCWQPARWPMVTNDLARKGVRNTIESLNGRLYTFSSLEVDR